MELDVSDRRREEDAADAEAVGATRAWDVARRRASVELGMGGEPRVSECFISQEPNSCRGVPKWFRLVHDGSFPHE